MSDEKEIGQISASEVMGTWSISGSYERTKPLKPESFVEPLSFSRALLFPIERVRPIDLMVEQVDYVQCPVCRIRITKLSKYCSNCGCRLNPDRSHENSW